MTSLGRIERDPRVTGVLGGDSFARVAKIALQSAGLSIPESKRTMVQSRLARRLKATGFADFDQYLEHVEGKGGEAERELMISALTTNVSHFFREDHHFEAIRERVIPDLFARARQGGRVRIWSAGCSTGQEPYTIAMTLLEAEPRVSDMDIRILASDIDQKVLATAKAGQYDERHLQAVPDAYRRKYFPQTGGDEGATFEASTKLKELIRFRQLNLMAQWPMRGSFDVIFCRNVVIYFSEETQNTLWPRFNAALAPGGWLFLGHSERINDPAQHGFETVGVTSYRRHGTTTKNATP